MTRAPMFVAARVTLLALAACAPTAGGPAALPDGTGTGTDAAAPPRGGRGGSPIEPPDGASASTGGARGDAAPAPPDLAGPRPDTATPLVDAAAPPRELDAAPPASDAAPVVDADRAHPTEWVFDPTRVRRYELTIEPADLAKMEADLARRPTSTIQEIEVPATLTVDGEAVGKISVRYKGAQAGLRQCFDLVTCKRYSYKLDFDDFEPAKRFHGLKKLNLHGLMRDKTYLHERLAYQLFRQMGVLAPRSVHGKVYVNGEYKGVYAVTENVDGRFLDHRFPKGQSDGNLYKDAWPTARAASYYVARQKTNEKADAVTGAAPVAPSRVLAFAEALSKTSGAAAVALVDKWMGVDHLLRMLAVDVAITNWDGPRAFYCAAGMICPGSHNHYTYEMHTEDRLHYVAWDLDLTFERVSPIEGDKGTNVPFWNVPVSAADCASRRWQATWGGSFWAPGCDPIYQALAAAGKPRWVAAIRQLLDGPFDLAKLNADIDRWAAQLDADVKLDTRGAPNGYDDWRAQLQKLKSDLAFLRQKMEAMAR